MSSSLRDHNIGDVLRRTQTIDRRQLRDAVERQKDEGRGAARLGSYLVALGYATADQVKEALDLQDRLRSASKRERLRACEEMLAKAQARMHALLHREEEG